MQSYFSRFRHYILQTLGRVLILILPPLRIKHFADFRSLVEVRIITRHTDVLSSICALRSFYQYSRIHTRCHIHIDPSVTRLDTMLLKHYLPFVTLVSYHKPEIVDNSTILKRLEHVWQGQKLLSMVMSKKSKKLIILDSDVLFFQLPKTIISWIKYGNKNMFMQDSGSFVMFSKGEFRQYFGTERISQNLNTGIVGLNEKYSKYEMKKLEEFFRVSPDIIHERLLPDYQTLYLDNNFHLIEQSAFIYLASVSEKFKFTTLNSNEYSLCANAAGKKNLTAVHYAGNMKIKNTMFEDYFKHIVHTWFS